jgi:hypothetical protein
VRLKLSLFLILCTAGELSGFAAVDGAVAAAVTAAENSPGGAESAAAARFVRVSAAGAMGVQNCKRMRIKYLSVKALSKKP